MKDLIARKLLLDHKITDVFSCVHMHTLFDICSVHEGIFDTFWGVQYIGQYHEYIRECLLQWGIS